MRARSATRIVGGVAGCLGAACSLVYDVDALGPGSASADAANDVAPATDAEDADNASDAAPEVTDDGGEFVEGVFGETSVRLTHIDLAELAPNGTFAVYADVPGADETQIDLIFVPQIGVSSCADTIDDNLIYATPGDSYQAVIVFPESSCTYKITAYGAVGEMVAGTFSGTMIHEVDGASDGTTISAKGSFRAIRRK